MRKRTEIEIKVMNGRIVKFNEIERGRYSFIIENVITNDDVFILIEASKLSLKDEFMQHEPKTKKEYDFKEILSQTINEGIKDFWRPKIDPSFDEERRGIYYEAGKVPALGESYEWWVRAAKEFMPERKSRLGTKKEYIAFLGFLIKKLIESGWEVKDAWNAVCNDSLKLGHYSNSEGAKCTYETTGSREICGFFDLSNTRKILAESENETDGYWLTKGSFDFKSNLGPLASLTSFVTYYIKDYYYHASLGWVVLEE